MFFDKVRVPNLDVTERRFKNLANVRIHLQANNLILELSSPDDYSFLIVDI